LRKAGVPVPKSPVGGSEWMAQNGFTSTPDDANMGLLGEAIGGISPMLVAAKGPQIARVINQAASNISSPGLLSSQAGMIRISGRGQIPETRGDVNKLADRFGSLLDDAGVQYTHDKSRLSPARYFEFDNPQTAASELGPDRFKVRISDHRNVHGADISVDPVTGGTFEEMLQSVRDIGIPVGDKVKPASKSVIDDATLQKIYGLSVEEMRSRGMNLDALRARYKMGKKGYWEQRE